jgi:DNA replication protein DnaC
VWREANAPGRRQGSRWPQRRSTLVTSQLDTKVWHDAFGDPTLADAVLDRLVNNAYRLDLEGESMRARNCPPELEG